MLIGRLIDLYSLVVLAAVIMSWVRIDSKQPLAMIVSSLTDPVLGPLRRALPPMGGLDFSPMVLLFGLQILGNLFR
jgi:YggT family protein